MIEYSIETSLHLLEVRIENSVTILDFVKFITQLRKETQYGPSLKTLFVVRSDAQLESFSPEAISSFFQRVEDTGGPAVWAIVLSNESHRLIFSRALESFVPKRLKLQFFEDEFPALRWLKSN